MDGARAHRCGHLCLHLAPQSRDHDHRLPLLNGPLGARVDVASARGQLFAKRAQLVAVVQRGCQYCCVGGRLSVSAIYGDDIHNKMKDMLAKRS